MGQCRISRERTKDLPFLDVLVDYPEFSHMLLFNLGNELWSGGKVIPARGIWASNLYTSYLCNPPQQGGTIASDQDQHFALAT